MSSLSPDLHGDIKSGQNSFLLEPVSRANLISSRSSRNFWVYINKDKIWSATGVSKQIKQIRQDKFTLEGGLLWQKITRENKSIGLRAEILSFAPEGAAVEIMQVNLTNVSRQSIKLIPTAAIPIYARGAGSIRDHRHVTSLLERVTLDKFGVIASPTLSFDEAGHKPNQDYYFVLACGGKGEVPQYIYPTQEMFCGEAGDLEAPESILNASLPTKENIQGKEVMGALRFGSVTLAPGKSRTYIVIMGITRDMLKVRRELNKFNTEDKVSRAFKQTQRSWLGNAGKINISTSCADFDNWFKWVSIQPILRKIFGCSFLPDFDYGKGGRGWRDLWQDCLGLILSEPECVRELLINNFSGVRIDGSNATIIGKNAGELIADRNDIARVWMDHGVWPMITTELYINETGDYGILFKETDYFCDQHIWRSAKINQNRKPTEGNKLKAVSGKIYKGLIYEHLLVQNLTQFFNVGEHNYIRLEGADWNDGLDMGKEFGESVAFSAMYAQNLSSLAELLLKSGKRSIAVAQELGILLKHFDYDNKEEKQKILSAYFTKVQRHVSGKKLVIDTATLARNLKVKSLWLSQRIRKNEWLAEGFFNGYYDNQKKRVEGKVAGLLKMCLASQVFPIMSGVADAKQVNQAIKSVNMYLLDKKLKGYHLNTNFSRISYRASGGIPLSAGKEGQPNLGRAFSFVYGEKENGAIFSHMVVLYAFALYSRGFVREGWKALSSLYKLAANTADSKIYPCLPEYFNSEGRGMYSYLTGSASWFILTLLTQAFGVRGKDGNLLIEPKLCAEQFEGKASISIHRHFAGARVQINISNPQKLDYDKYKILKASLNSKPLQLVNSGSILINRKVISPEFLK